MNHYYSRGLFIKDKDFIGLTTPGILGQGQVQLFFQIQLSRSTSSSEGEVFGVITSLLHTTNGLAKRLVIFCEWFSVILLPFPDNTDRYCILKFDILLVFRGVHRGCGPQIRLAIYTNILNLDDVRLQPSKPISTALLQSLSHGFRPYPTLTSSSPVRCLRA